MLKGRYKGSRHHLEGLAKGQLQLSGYQSPRSLSGHRLCPWNPLCQHSSLERKPLPPGSKAAVAISLLAAESNGDFSMHISGGKVFRQSREQKQRSAWGDVSGTSMTWSPAKRLCNQRLSTIFLSHPFIRMFDHFWSFHCGHCTSHPKARSQRN